jgi:hypothetical protein
MGAYTQLWGATVATPAQITAQVRRCMLPGGTVLTTFLFLFLSNQ